MSQSQNQTTVCIFYSLERNKMQLVVWEAVAQMSSQQTQEWKSERRVAVKLSSNSSTSFSPQVLKSSCTVTSKHHALFSSPSFQNPPGHVPTHTCACVSVHWKPFRPSSLSWSCGCWRWGNCQNKENTMNTAPPLQLCATSCWGLLAGVTCLL